MPHPLHLCVGVMNIIMIAGAVYTSIHIVVESANSTQYSNWLSVKVEAMRVHYLFSAVCLLFLGSQCASQSLTSYFRDYERRQQVIDIFEKALIANPTNIFILREIFYPSNDYPSSSLYVSYYVQLHKNVTFNTSTQWCRTSVSVEASSLMMLTLSSGLIFFVQGRINRHTLLPSSIGLFLNISNNTIEGGFSEKDFEYAVKYITPWVSLICA